MIKVAVSFQNHRYVAELLSNNTILVYTDGVWTGRALWEFDRITDYSALLPNSVYDRLDAALSYATSRPERAAALEWCATHETVENELPPDLWCYSRHTTPRDVSVCLRAWKSVQENCSKKD